MGRLLDILSAIITPGDTDSNASAGSPVVGRVQGFNGTTWTRLAVTTAGLLKLAVQVASGATAPADALAIGGKASDGKLYTLVATQLGHLQVLPAKGTGGQSSAVEISHVISAVACWPARIGFTNTTATARTAQMFNATSLPANGAVPVSFLGAGAAPAASNKSWTLPVDRFTVGCVAAFSSTQTTLTAVVANEAFFEWDLYPSPV